uniref:STX17-like N-terminal domain-containing protein n=1 Tax=Heliothis virescens TaxID=7102 RepID=A0A2A4IY10_HELVI
MDDEDKLPLKRVEFSLNKFNEVAIPHHLDLLRQHKANIIKYSAAGEWARARAEQTHARRVAAQLRGLLAELDALRRRVRDADLARFDAQTQRSRDTTLRAIVDYLGLIEASCRALVSSSPRRRLPGSSPVSIDRASEAQVAASATSTESVGVVAHALEDDALAPHIQLVVQHDEAALREREELLRGWSELQAELRALHDVWQTAQAAALAQREQVLRVPLRLNYLGDWSQLTFLFL